MAGINQVTEGWFLCEGLWTRIVWFEVWKVVVATCVNHPAKGIVSCCQANGSNGLFGRERRIIQIW